MTKIFKITFFLFFLLAPIVSNAERLDSEEFDAARSARCNIDEVYNAFVSLSDSTGSGLISCQCQVSRGSGTVYKKKFLFSSLTEENVFFSNPKNGFGKVSLSSDGSSCNITNNCYSGSSWTTPVNFNCGKVAAPYCCCKDVGAGSLTKNRECKIIEGSDGRECNSSIFEGVFGGGAFASEPGYVSFGLDSSGSCDQYIKEAEGYSGVASTQTVGVLKKEAADVLNPMKFKTGSRGVNELIGRFVYALTFTMGTMLLAFYIYAGILWMTSAGNSEKVGLAKKIVVWSTLGVVVMLASYAIVSFVFKFAG